jgi:dipeptidyl aminopeptidase/acylaminoacyl peptidase
MERITAADYHDIVHAADPQVAPGGERVAFVRKEPDGEEEYAATVYVVPTGGEEPRRFTVAEGVDSEPRWSPSGDRLAFVSTRGADDDRPQLWVLPTDGGEARQVTNVAGGVSSIEWSPDGSHVAFTQQASAEDREEERDLAVPAEFEPDDPDPRVIDRTVHRAFQQYFDGKRSHVYVVDLEAVPESGAGGEDDGDAIERLTDGDADFQSPTWGDAETVYYAESVGEDPDDSTEYEIVAHDLPSGDVETLHRTTGWAAGLDASEDGRIVHAYQDPDRSSIRQTQVKVYHRDSDSVTHPTAGLDRTLGYDTLPQWGAAETDVYFLAPDEGSVVLWRAPGDGSGDPKRVIDDGHVDGADVGEDVVAFTRSEWDHPGEVFVASRGGSEIHQLTRLNSHLLDDRAVAKPERIAFESEQGPVEGWVLTPPDFDPEERYPLAVEVHGGPHVMWSTAGTMWHEFQTLAARGYVVFWSNPRGSAGYGEEYMAAIDRDWGAVTMTDVMAGVRDVAGRDYVDDTNVFLTGGSFGGYMTSWMVGHTDYFSGAVTQRGVHDLIGFYGSTDMAYKLVEGDYDTTPWEEPAFLWEQSPVAYCDQVETPTLVIHSDRDYRTPANTAELFHRGLRKHGVDTRFVRYPREGHELSRSGEPGHVVDRIERIARWFDGYSEHHDAPRALERDPEAGLSAGEEAGDEEDADTES